MLMWYEVRHKNNITPVVCYMQSFFRDLAPGEVIQTVALRPRREAGVQSMENGLGSFMYICIYAFLHVSP